MPGEKLVLLLIGYGDLEGGYFRLRVTTNSRDKKAEGFFTKGLLEQAVEDCQGDILVICNACYSGELASDRWTLLCSAGPEQMADALTGSSSGYFRRSLFTACVVAVTARERG